MSTRRAGSRTSDRSSLPKTGCFCCSFDNSGHQIVFSQFGLRKLYADGVASREGVITRTALPSIATFKRQRSIETTVENTQVGPFLIVKRLGTNRRQQVFHARQVKQDREVALKFIKVPPSVEWSRALDKIQREFTELQKLKHKNLVKVYGAGVEGEKIFVASELIEGESLAAIMTRRGKLMPDLVVDYGKQIAELLQYLHKKDLVHAKLTPEKILITPDNKVKIADLRLNRAKKRRWDATKRHALDIAAYMAPEQFTEGATPKSDFYALGVILFEMLTGKLPYEPDTMGRMTRNKMNAPVPSVASHIMNCPIWLDKIIVQMLNPETRERPHSARAIVFAFEEIKKIDKNRKSAVGQMTGTFNPLTAGQDKTEANQLLGKKEIIDAEPRTPFYQYVAFQVAALVAIVAFVIWMAIPKGADQILEEATVSVNSRDPKAWRSANEELKRLMAGSDESIAAEAERLYYQSRRQILVLNAEDGVRNKLQSESVGMFVDAVQLQLKGEKFEALKLFRRLVATVSTTGKERHVFYESVARVQNLSAEVRMPTNKDELLELVESTELSTTLDELITAENLLVRVVIDYADKPDYQSVCVAAQKSLAEVRQRLELLRNPPTEDGVDVEPVVEEAGEVETED